MCTQTPSMITGQHCAESPNAESSARQNTSCAKQMHTNPNMHAQLTPALPKYAQHSHNISYMIQGRRAPAPPQVMVWSRAHVTPLSGNGLVPGPLAPLVMVWSQGCLPRPLWNWYSYCSWAYETITWVEGASGPWTILLPYLTGHNRA